jgi:hypothetical protein
VVSDGEATGDGQSIQLNPFSGVHVYVSAPEAERVTLCPGPILATSGDTVSVSEPVAVTLFTAVTVHPSASVMVAVYVPEESPVTEEVEPLPEDHPYE